MTSPTTAPEPRGRGRGRPRTGRVRVSWTMPPDIRAAIEAQALADGVTESALVEAILRASRRLKRA